MSFKKLFGIFIILFLILLIPSSFASDEADSLNLTDAADDNPIINSYQDDLISEPDDYYFNSSAEDGHGTIDNPYKYLTGDRIKDFSTIHLANGEYLLDNGMDLEDVTIIGENPEKTIIRYSGDKDCGTFNVGFYSYLTLKNVTLIGFNIDLKAADLEANNTIFKNTVGRSVDSQSSGLVNSATHSFGGTIYADFDEDDEYIYISCIYLNNCTFINNTAGYGGAIYMNNGYLSILNSQFINNTAYSYAGAIAALNNSEVRINNTRFINDKSMKDAGGAIYLTESCLYSNNLTIFNCSATFGGAITSLNSTVDLSYLNATANSAQYRGGAIYQMYNDASITYSSFINNTAYDGGAIFADDLDVFNLAYNSFEENKAMSMAGAVYLLAVDRFNENGNSYFKNRANNSDDLYRTDMLVYTISNGNYTLIYSDYEFVGEIPESYDLRQEGYVTSIKDQGDGGNCWAFAIMAALESSILKASGYNWDLSEGNLKNLMAMFSDYGKNKVPNGGGSENMGIAYLASWLGPVNESLDEYDDFNMLSNVFNSIVHVQNAVFLSRSDFTDNDAIKKAILNYGAVYSGIYMDEDYFDSIYSSYYYDDDFDYTNHAVVIVGWDDNYDKYKFSSTPPENGAWIVKNSWADDWGDEGYFYVSYYDASVAGYMENAIAFVFNDSERYDKNYQYDIVGPTDYYPYVYEDYLVDTIWVENIFTATDDELLSAVSTYFIKTENYELSIYVNDNLVLSQSGKCNPGYTTIKLNKGIALNSGDKFTVRFKFTSNDGAQFALSESAYASKVTFTRGVSFYSEDGIIWEDLYSTSLWDDFYSPQVASIKAFTKSYDFNPDVQLSVSTDNNFVNVWAKITDFGHDIIYQGDVRINIDGVDYFAAIEDSTVNFTHVVSTLGYHQINITFKNFTYNTTVNIEKIDVGLSVEANAFNNDVIFTVKSSMNANCRVKLLINNEVHYVNLANGEGTLRLNNNQNSYVVHATVDEGSYVGDYATSFVKIEIVATDFTSNYNLENYYFVQLKDCFGSPMVNYTVYFIVGDKTFSALTDNLGTAQTLIQLSNRNIKSMTIRVDGAGEYIPSSATVNVAVRSTIQFVTSNYLANTLYQAILFDAENNPLAFTQINVIINGKSYWYFTDAQGRISIPLEVGAGSYGVEVLNHITGENAHQTINVVSRIMGNADMTVYYLSASTYSVRVYGDNGLPVGAGQMVQINVNNNVYFISTDANGFVHFKISLKPNTYTITAFYKGALVSNKIVVKPLLTAKNIVKKKAKKIKFQAKLVNTLGKPVKGKKITFKIKGKTYKAKTNAKGIAKIYIKNLKVGKYTIITKYGKSKIKNTIRIKK